MFAVVRTGGKQYRVAQNDRITVEKLDSAQGETVTLGDVLMIAEDGKPPLIGAPALDGAAVFAEVVEQTRGDKILVFKKKRRKNYRRTKGHRQDLTILKITGISADGKPPAGERKRTAKPKTEKAGAAATEPAAAETPAPEAAAEQPAPAPEADIKKTDAPASETGAKPEETT